MLKVHRPIEKILDKSNQGTAASLGLKCPQCGCVQFASGKNVTTTRRLENAVLRYRTCRACGFSFKTLER